MRLRRLTCALFAGLMAVSPLVAHASDAETATQGPAFDWSANGTSASADARVIRAQRALIRADGLNTDASWVCTLAGSGKPSRCRRG